MNSSMSASGMSVLACRGRNERARASPRGPTCSVVSCCSVNASGAQRFRFLSLFSSLETCEEEVVSHLTWADGDRMAGREERRAGEGS
jgi:hypothetical protein